MTDNPLTGRNYTRLNTAYDRFNRDLFGNALPRCLITFQRHAKARGYYCRNMFHARRGKQTVDEIALNPDTFPGRADREVMSTLVHEMVHLWQAHFGKPGRRGYHNKEWAAKMEEVGLRPSTTGQKGGDRTGERVSHYIISRGRFEEAWGELYREGLRLEWEAVQRSRTDKDKVKYTCPECEINVWGKPGLADKLLCAECGAGFQVWQE